MAKRKPARKPAPFPTRQQVIDFINDSPTAVGKREIARAFNLGPADKVRIPDGVKVEEFPDAHAYPGLVDALSSAFANSRELARYVCAPTRRSKRARHPVECSR